MLVVSLFEVFPKYAYISFMSLLEFMYSLHQSSCIFTNEQLVFESRVRFSCELTLFPFVRFFVLLTHLVCLCAVDSPHCKELFFIYSGSTISKDRNFFELLSNPSTRLYPDSRKLQRVKGSLPSTSALINRKLSACDQCEIARNSVYQSGFSHALKV